MSAHKLIRILTAMELDEARAVFRAFDRRVADPAERMGALGFELVPDWDKQALTADGREVVQAHGQAWVLRPEEHAKHRQEMLDQAVHRDKILERHGRRPASSSSGSSTCASLIDGQLCGGTRTRAPVCPKSALGRSGVAATLTCDVCGHVTAIMRGEA